MITRLDVRPDHLARWPSVQSDEVVELAVELAFDAPSSEGDCGAVSTPRAVLFDLRRHAVSSGDDADTVAAALAMYLHLTRATNVKTAVVVPRERLATAMAGVRESPSKLRAFEDEDDALEWLVA